ncbi:MAG: hypothetical protein WC593_07350 [Methanoregula sp.]
MNFGSPLKQDLCWCPDVKPVLKADRLSFQGPFLHVTDCFEKTGDNRKNRWCLMFITSSMMIIMPVPHAFLQANPVAGVFFTESNQAKPATKQSGARDNDSVLREQQENLIRQYLEKDPDEVFIAEPDTNAIPLDTIKEITITWVNTYGRYSRPQFLFGLYPVEPANARYHVTFQLVVTTGNKSVVVITPFSPELRQTLRDLLGKRVHEIPDEYAPLL